MSTGRAGSVWEAKRRRKRRVDVQRVPVAAEPIDERLFIAELVGGNVVGGTVGRVVDIFRGATLATKAATAAHERADVVFGDEIAAVRVVGVDVGDDDGVLPLS